MTETVKNTPWELHEIHKFPFGYEIRAGDETIIRIDCLAHSSSQRTFADCMDAVGFPASDRERIIAHLLKQRENMRAIVRCVNCHYALLAALKHIASGMGNLSLDEMGPKGVHGINDGKQRAIYLEEFVKQAREALAA